MSEIIRNRTIRPSTRHEKSKSYKINTRAVSLGDILVVNIDHEIKPFHTTYKFNGRDIVHKDSISFRVNEFETSIEINWSGAKPIDEVLANAKSIPYKPMILKVINNTMAKAPSTNTKTSFAPLSNFETTVLILGTLPGDKSLELGEYYAHSRNRFWKIISTITNNELPKTYLNKKQLLLTTKIGIWDVAHTAIRKGSLDDAIEYEEPNQLDDFISRHINLKVIGFNGLKSKSLFDKYFEKKRGIKYIYLPSSSPANTSIDFENLCKTWQQILIKD